MDHRTSLPQFRYHPRDWRENHFVYPVISRRSGGLSIGINLNPDKACNFDCVYCQVDRSTPPRVRDVDLGRLRDELARMIVDAVVGTLYDDPEFQSVPEFLRGIRDLAFSGDGEPTTCPEFPEAVELAARMKREAGLGQVKLVLITDGCYLKRPRVAGALRILDDNQGEIWAKLDAGTEEYYRRVNRPNYSLGHVLENIVDAARTRPLVIQSLFMRLDGSGPEEGEISAFADRLKEIVAAGGRIARVQVYTVARRPAESYVAPLSDDEVRRLSETVRSRTGLEVDEYFSGV